MLHYPFKTILNITNLLIYKRLGAKPNRSLNVDPEKNQSWVDVWDRRWLDGDIQKIYFAINS
jgi:hypothetical protein